MKVSVLLAMPAQESLRESASAALEGRSPSEFIRSAKVPPGFRADPEFAAMPLGSLEKAVATSESIAPEESEDFAVRGAIEVDSVDDLPTTMDGARVFSDPVIDAFPYCANAAQGTASDVESALDTAGLAGKGLDGNKVAIAIVDSGINLAHLKSKLGSTPSFDAANSWRPGGASGQPGLYPIDHGTMCAYCALLAAPKATLLDYPVLSTTVPGGNVTGRSISTALQAFAHLLANYAVAFAPGGPGKYNGLVVNNSWGIYHPSWDFPSTHPGRFCDNPNHPFNHIVRALTAAGADIVFAAGNCGSDCPDGRCQGRSSGAIMGSSSYAEVLTVAACLVTTKDRLGYSSQGPSIANMPQQKPDVTGYAHFLGSEAFGSGTPDSGTSTACPVVAGCVAAIRTKESANSTPPANLIQQIHLTAKQNPGTGPGWNADFGHGVIDPMDLASSLGL
jgi:subtilisin family serine protease